MQFKKIILLLFFFSSFCSFSQESLIGTFYGGWARNKGDYIWIKDHGQEAQLVAVGDVNGDGFEDAITVTSGTWNVALSESYTDYSGKIVRHFGKISTFLEDFGTDADNFLVGDINGDSKSDIAIFTQSTGKWEFAISTGTSFDSTSITITNFGSSGSHPFLSDVNGDKKVDAVTYDAETWKVAINTGIGFESPQIFAENPGTPEAKPALADVNGDEKSDAIRILSGSVIVEESDGTSFNQPYSWKNGLICDEIMFADVDGDKKADLIIYNEHYKGKQNRGRWDFAPSNGNNAFGEFVFWCGSHGSYDVKMRHSKGLPKAHRFFTGYVQSSKTSEYGVSPIAFNKDYGHWQVMPPFNMFPGITTPNWYCSWHYNNRAAIPLIDDEYYGFDAEDDTFAVLSLVKAMADADIDFVMLDQTNPWEALLKAHQLFAYAVCQWNKVPGNRKVKYAICGKYKNNAGEVEASAKSTLEDFIHHPDFGGEENYQFPDGKPLLVCYGGVQQKHKKWANYTGSKTNAGKFTLKWMDGSIWPSSTSIDPFNKGNWYGWYLPEGTLENKEQMVVQPGFYNGNAFTSRWYKGTEGDWYRRNWDKVLLNNPKAVTIISFVGDPEQNDVFNMAPGKYAYAMNKTEHRSYPEMYWEMTKDYIQNYRLLRRGEIQQIAEYGTEEISDSKMVVNFTKRFSETPVVYASIEGEPGTKKISITNITTNSFYVEPEGITKGMDKLNWLAVLPGEWETPEGMKVSAQKNSASVESTGQMTVFKTSDTKTAGSICIETGKTEFWSGRFCTALKVENSGNEEVSFMIPRYFYDNLLTLNYSSNSDVQPVTKSTTNTEGTICYSSPYVPTSDTINVICFDGAGGCLYGKQLKTTAAITENRNNGIKLFPNPVHKTLNICREDPSQRALLEIVGMDSGITEICEIKRWQSSIDVSHLSQGVYLMRLNSQNEAGTERIIKIN